MRNLAVILPYAVSIRDFVHTGTLDQLLSIPDVRMQIYTQNPALPEFDAIRSDRVSIFEMAEPHDSRVEQLLKTIYPLMFYDTFYYVRQALAASRLKRILAKGLVAMRRIIGTQRTLRLYARLLLATAPRPTANQIVGDPDLVIATRSTINSLDYGLLVEAARRRLPQLTAASSWDNFTTKGFFPFPVVRIVVWNRKMADELEQIFDVDADTIVEAGYPRLRLLENSGTIRDGPDYLGRIGLGSYRRFILYSASYAELTRVAGDPVPREYRLIREVAARLAPTLPNDTCILVRLHPFSKSEDESFFADIPHLRVFVPGRGDRYVERVMSEADEVHLAAQLRFSECIVSMASTMTIDALAVGRPVINVAFEPDGAAPGMISNFYRFNHFRDLIATVHLPLAHDANEVTRFVERSMTGSDALTDGDTPDMVAFEKLYVPENSRAYPNVVRRVVEELLIDA
ncbi:hypothetical protein KCP91_18915 [Microvirga sp. SRT01]|uniref:Uncharacterized protein n=1 Tax=Sphingomonas longa TaxID=2778730 RepID=A0ABS2DBY6_9SPHN|nr:MULTISPECIES: hypothetical protein [Alphaproteobacteria]MBM6578460.1 hypothetical protein [Sphingomonas sp. BT552]MBR7711500.1 hypothetical protein [Microvirga sp. SRT01]